MSEDLLYEEIYQKTQDCGRAQFVKLLQQNQVKIEQLQQENEQLKQKYEFQKDSNNLLCKAITCDDCDCSICKAHKENIRLQQENEELKKNLFSSGQVETVCPKCGEKYFINYSREVYDLQRENKELKEKLEENTKIYLHTSRYASKMEGEYIGSNYILTEFEKWLEEEIKCTEQYADNDMAKGYINAMKLCKYYLQELKEGKK